MHVLINTASFNLTTMKLSSGNLARRLLQLEGITSKDGYFTNIKCKNMAVK
jgi:hypothetical protein